MTNKHIIKNFKHEKGFHCESSSMRDMFEFYGFPMSEAMAFGLDATMGFAFFDKSDRLSSIKHDILSEIPFFIGGKQNTINEDSLSCRLLGIKLTETSFTSADKAWKNSKQLIDRDIPMIVRVDMFYLPWFNFTEEFHFGGHTLTLAGYDDEDKEVAFVGDTHFDGFQEIPINSLKKARSSGQGDAFMLPKNTQFTMERRADKKHPPLSAGVKLAIQQVVNNMLRPSMNYIGIQGLKKFITSIPKWSNTLKGKIQIPNTRKIDSLAKLTFFNVYGFIEEYGTGGSLFRKLYASFCEELIEYPEINEGLMAWTSGELKLLEDSIPLIKESAENWSLLANNLKNAIDEGEENCIDHLNLLELLEIAQKIYFLEEKFFKNLSKIRI